jgi:dTDP-4-dehydrorhamnose 3,5-epimerase
MLKKDLDIEGAYLLEQEIIEDHRGAFSRLFSSEDLTDLNLPFVIKQINFVSTTRKGTIRGLHYQIFPYGETKIFKCVSGSFHHVFVDMRKQSSNYLKFGQVILNSKEARMLHVPEGIAHGMQSLEDYSEAIYFSSEGHNPEFERLVHYADPRLNINWLLKDVIVSDKDKNAPFII